MPITQPTIDDFQDSTVMRVIRKVVNYLVALVPKINDEIDNLNMINEEALAQQNAKITANTQDITANTQAIATNAQAIATNAQGIATNRQDIADNKQDIADNTQAIANNTQSIATIEANVEALNKELPSEIRVNYTPSTGNFNIDYVKEDGDVLTSNTVVIVSGSTGEVTIVQNTSGISINGTALQSATTAQPGLMTPALVSSLNNVNDTTNDHTTMLNAQAEAITALDDRVDVLEQAGGGAKRLVDSISEVVTLTSNGLTVTQDFEIQYIYSVAGEVYYSPWIPVEAGDYPKVSSNRVVGIGYTYSSGGCGITCTSTSNTLYVICAGSYNATLLTEGESPTSTGTSTSDKSYFYRIRVKA